MADLWMQTTGVGLLAVKRCSPTRVRRMPPRTALAPHRLLCLAAVQNSQREQEDRQGRVDVGRASLMGREGCKPGMP